MESFYAIVDSYNDNLQNALSKSGLPLFQFIFLGSDRNSF